VSLVLISGTYNFYVSNLENQNEGRFLNNKRESEAQDENNKYEKKSIHKRSICFLTLRKNKVDI
jgi:hypothetical protein